MKVIESVKNYPGKIKEVKLYISYGEPPQHNIESIKKEIDEQTEGNETGRKKNRSAYEVTGQNLIKSKSRAINNFRDLVLSNNCHRMMTINFWDNITDYKIADKIFNKFMTELKRLYPEHEDLKYVGVRERQKRGALHYHLLINKYLPQREMQVLWNKIIRLNGYAGGHVDIRRKRGFQAINYCVKYITKIIDEYDFIDEETEQRAKMYICSQGMKRADKRETIYTCKEMIMEKIRSIEQQLETCEEIGLEYDEFIYVEGYGLIVVKKFIFKY